MPERLDSLAITSELIRAARALLRWEQRDLARASGVSLPTIKRLEGAPGILAAHSSTVTALRRAFESAGIEFTNGGGPGVRVRAVFKNENAGDHRRRRTKQSRFP
jgi:transcriptional regulator with XRE-family HTH domain